MILLVSTVALSPDDALELLLAGPDSPGLPLASAESTLALNSALTLSLSSSICTLHDDPPDN